ncbi:MAG TPA: thioesterase family protein [Candidatus Dormibacteraeota bacterium]|nr:thioesterase family protein [Candidatus Dormibacteraeota bacterium]
MSEAHFTVADRVRWSEVDRAGIIYFGAYVRFIELAETEMLRTVGLPFSEIFDRFDIWLPRVHLEFDFFSPARLDEMLEVRTTIERIGRSSIATRMEMWSLASGVQCAAARMIVACVDRETLTSQPLPEGILSALAPYAKPESEG